MKHFKTVKPTWAPHAGVTPALSILLSLPSAQVSQAQPTPTETSITAVDASTRGDGITLGVAPQTKPKRSCNEGDVQRLCEIPEAQGDCALGVIRCVDGQWSECLPRFRQLQERCGAQPRDKFGLATGDEDCDGSVDELGPTPPVNCQMYMLDADKDGYGAIGANYADNPMKATYGCFCPSSSGEVPLEFAVPSGGKHNLDCGDCPEHQDKGQLVHPGATEYHELPSECLSKTEWKGGTFDYNCSGESERQHLAIQGCSFDLSKLCGPSGSGYWSPNQVGNIPDCGQLGFFSSCVSWPQVLEGRYDFCYIRNNSHPTVQSCR